MANKLKWKKWVEYKVIDYAQRGLVHAATDIYAEAQNRVPLDDGELTTGARVSSEGKLSDHFEVAVSYGNNEVSKEYAVKIHEDMSLNHPNGGQAKFLESAFVDKKATVLPRIRQYIRDILL